MSWMHWAFGSALFAALTAIFAKLGVENIPANLATAIRTTVSLVICWIIASVTCGTGSFSAITARSWIFLGLSGLATGLSWLCYFQALKLGDVSKVAPVDKLSVVIAIVLAAIFLGERFNAREAMGAGLIVVGVFILSWK